MESSIGMSILTMHIKKLETDEKTCKAKTPQNRLKMHKNNINLMNQTPEIMQEKA